MKKSFLPVVATALLLFVGACQRESLVIPIVEEDETLKDELYTPDVLIDHVAIGVADMEQWTWDGKTLRSIALTGSTEGKTTFLYADNRVSKVVTSTDKVRILHYTYANGKMNRYNVDVDGEQEASVTVTRNGEGRIGGADINFSGRYVLDLVDRYRNGDDALVTARPAYRPAMEQLSTTMEWMGVSDADVDSKLDHNFKLTLNWYNGNVASEVMNGEVRLEIDPQRVAEDLTFLPDNLRLLVYTYLVSHNKLPVKVGFSNVATYTFDEEKNPYHGYQGDGLTARNLSKNNILTATTNGNIRVSLLISGREITLSNRDINDKVELTYLYNEAGYPVQISGNSLTVLTYCDK